MQGTLTSEEVRTIRDESIEDMRAAEENIETAERRLRRLEERDTPLYRSLTQKLSYARLRREEANERLLALQDELCSHPKSSEKVHEGLEVTRRKCGDCGKVKLEFP